MYERVLPHTWMSQWMCCVLNMNAHMNHRVTNMDRWVTKIHMGECVTCHKKEFHLSLKRKMCFTISCVRMHQTFLPVRKVWQIQWIITSHTCTIMTQIWMHVSCHAYETACVMKNASNHRELLMSQIHECVMSQIYGWLMIIRLHVSNVSQKYQ